MPQVAIAIECENCGKEFHDYLSNKRRFCSKKCADIASCIPVDLSPTDNLGYFTGIMFGDGCICYQNAERTNNYDMRVFTTDKELANVFIESCKKFGLNTTVQHKNFKGIKWGRFYDQNNIIVSVYSKILFDFLRQYKKANSAWIYPESYKTAEFIKGFLRGIDDAEGSVSGHGGQNIRIDFSQKFPENVLKIKELLSQLGIQSNFYAEKGRNMSKVAIYKKEYIEKYAKTIGFSLPRKTGKLLSLMGGYN